MKEAIIIVEHRADERWAWKAAAYTTEGKFIHSTIALNRDSLIRQMDRRLTKLRYSRKDSGGEK